MREFIVETDLDLSYVIEFTGAGGVSFKSHGELIRCKDCKHARKCYGDVVWTSKGGGYIYKPLGTDGFCSRAERKEE